MNTFRTLAASLLLSLLFALPSFAAETVNINTADAATIDRVLLNVGPAKAEAIVAYRKQHGAFRSAEALAQVKGIGLRTIEKNRGRIVLGGAPARPAAVPAKPAVKKPAGRQ
jgi:competence protein ComEA